MLAAVTEAYVGDNGKINYNNDGAAANQSVLVKAVSNALVVMTEGSIGGAGAAGVSGSVNIGIISNITKAHLGGAVNARRDIEVMALSHEDFVIVTLNASGGGAAVGSAVGAGCA